MIRIIKDPKLTTDLPAEPIKYPGKPLPHRFKPSQLDTIYQKSGSLYVQDISKAYLMGGEPFWALKHISLEIKSGEFVAILGPSGSGKSTLLHIIGGLDRPSEGSIFVDAENLSKLSDKKLAAFRNKKIGFVFQFFNLIPKTSVFDNVYLPFLYSRETVDKPKDKVNQLLTSLGLANKLKSKPNEISGGEQQRVAIARALINNPTIILADEPTGNLDSKTGLDILKILLSLKERGKTIIMVTHEQHLANSADRIINIKDGSLV